MLQLGMNLAQGLLDQYIRERGNLGRGFRQGCDPKHVAQHDADVLPLLETCQQCRRIGFKRARPHSGEALLEFLARMGAIQAAVADKALKQIAVVDQGLAQPGADGKHHDGIMNQKLMLLQQPQQLGRSRLGQPFKLIDRRIGIRRAWKQSRECFLNSRRYELANVSKVSLGRFRIAKLHVRGEH